MNERTGRRGPKGGRIAQSQSTGGQASSFSQGEDAGDCEEGNYCPSLFSRSIELNYKDLNVFEGRFDRARGLLWGVRMNAVELKQLDEA